MNEAPIRSACWRVETIGGVERPFFWAVTLGTAFAIGLALFLGAWLLALPLFVLASAVLAFLRRSAQEDPMAPRVWLRWVFEPRRVAAVGRFDRRSSTTTRRKR